ncbi:hypothetical protein BDY19DRAFT_993370 [Irpex rosettiformis]|uniref:Uncharacterized protein n=1 Tax=Irpex rosettiformis TaxID=378272 RepID=A0ACB8U4R0_9APHY|nr:hypothetical protein BDY19DRAFT_993370 [Irpex rosettiformis]
MNIITLFILAAVALFNIGQLPQPLPTVYQLTLNGVESIVCDLSASTLRRGTVCNILDALRLPAAPVVLTIVAPPPPKPASLPTETNSSLNDEPTLEFNRRLPPAVVSTSLIVSPMVSSQSIPTSPAWMLPSFDTIVTLFYVLLATFWMSFIVITIWHNDHDPRKSIVRWLTWFFCDRFKARRASSKDYRNVLTADQVDYGSYDDIHWDLFRHKLAAIRSVQPVVPGPSPPVVEEMQPEGPELELRKHVRSAARCQRIRRQKARARAEQQEHVATEEPQAETDREAPVEARRNKRGGKQVRKRQRKQELKEARRAAVNAEAGPSSIPATVPELNDDNFPALPGTNIEPNPVQYQYSFAIIAEVGRPSPTAAIRWTVKTNPDPEPSRPRLERRAADSRVKELREEWVDMEEEVWRKGRRKRKKSGQL